MLSKNGVPLSLSDIERVLSSLSNQDALKIFYMAKDGITSSTEAIRKLGLTQKRYYARLSELLKTNLIQKDDGVYKHTTLGNIIYKMIEHLNDVISEQEQLELIEKIKLSKTLSEKDKEEIIRSLAKNEMMAFIDLIDGGVRPVGVIYKFEDVVDGTIELIEKAEKEVYIASRYTENKIVEAILKNLNKRIEWHLISGDKSNLSQKFQLLRIMLSHPKMIKIYYDIFRSQNVQTGYLENLPYSFIIVDRKYVGVELPKPESNEFFIGFFLENKILAEKLIEVFNLLMARAKEDPR
ncbi:MAG: hypothetical protein QXU67_03680, partial [Candidatus Bathyarchaeia archaeon]